MRLATALLALLALTAPALAQPDLDGDNALFPDPSRLQPGGSFLIGYNYGNGGNQPAPDFEVGLYLSFRDDDFEPDVDRFLDRDTLAGMGVQQNSGGSIRLTVPPDTPCGGYYVLAIADDRDLIPETDETNNLNSGGITVCGESSSPDLLAFDAEQEEQTVAPGGRVQIRYTILNQGSTDAGTFQAVYYLRALNAPRREWVRLGSEPIGNVEAGEREDESEQLTIPLGTAPGRYAIIVSVDNANVITEREENNNYTGFGIFEITGTTAGEDDAGDEALGLRVSPNPSTSGARVALRIGAAAEARVVVVDALGRTVAVLADGRLGVGEASLAVPALPPGVYVVRARVGTVTRTARFTVVR